METTEVDPKDPITLRVDVIDMGFFIYWKQNTWY